MKLTGSVLILFASIFYLGCTSSSSPDSPQTIQNAFPLKIGNSWTYQISGYDPNGILLKDTVGISIDSAGTVNGHAGFYVWMYGVGFIYYSGDDLMASDLTGDDPQFWMRYPMEVGEEFVIKDTSSGSYRERDVIRLISKNAVVTVPAGTFTCIWYKTIGMDNTIGGGLDTTTTSDFYVALGVGRVKEESYIYYPDPANPDHVTTELIRYTVK